MQVLLAQFHSLDARWQAVPASALAAGGLALLAFLTGTLAGLPFLACLGLVGLAIALFVRRAHRYDGSFLAHSAVLMAALRKLKAQER